MARVKRGTTKVKRRNNVLAQTKGMRGRISTKERAAHEALLHAGNHAFNDRRKKKGDFRRLWTVKLNAAVRGHGMSYSGFAGALKKKNIGLNRKVLSEIAHEHPESFERLVAEVK